MPKLGWKLAPHPDTHLSLPVSWSQPVCESFSAQSRWILHVLHLKPNLPFDQIPSYTILTAGAIYKAIKILTLMDIDKWVNDIYYKKIKDSRYLTEATTSIENGQVTDVIGVGFNFSIKGFS